MVSSWWIVMYFWFKWKLSSLCVPIYVKLWRHNVARETIYSYIHIHTCVCIVLNIVLLVVKVSKYQCIRLDCIVVLQQSKLVAATEYVFWQYQLLHPVNVDLIKTTGRKQWFLHMRLFNILLLPLLTASATQRCICVYIIGCLTVGRHESCLYFQG